MITRLSLENFKSWRSLPDMKLAPITGLFGTNSSGKSSILQWLLLMKQTVESADRQQPLDLGGDRNSFVDLGTFREILFGNEDDAELSASLAWRSPDPIRTGSPRGTPGGLAIEEREHAFDYQVRFAAAKSPGVLVKRMSYRFQDRRYGLDWREDAGAYALYSEPDEYLRPVTETTFGVPRLIKCYGFPDEVRALYHNAEFLADLALAFEHLFERVHYLGPLRARADRYYVWSGERASGVGSGGERTIATLLTGPSPDGTIREFQDASTGTATARTSADLQARVAGSLRDLGLVSEFSVERAAPDADLYRVWVRRSPEAARVLLPDVGLGVSQVLPVLTLCYSVPKGSTVLLEHPEVHLHPSAQSGLADVFIDAIQTRKIQIIVESHSEHLLTRLQRRIAEEKLAPADAALYFCSMEDGASHLTPLDLDAFGNIKNWPEDFFGDPFGEVAARMDAAMARRQKVAGQ